MKRNSRRSSALRRGPAGAGPMFCRHNVEFECEHRGTVAYHAAWDVRRGRIWGRVAPTTRIATFNQLVDVVMRQEPDHHSTRPFWIVDGGGAHHLSTCPARLQEMYANAVAGALPTRSSWLDQVEIYFSMAQRKVLTPLDVKDETTLTQRVLDFQAYYQETVQPFKCKFTADDLQKRLAALQHFAAA